MFSVSLCFAPADDAFALELGLYLERNTRARVDLIAPITPKHNLLKAAEKALACDVALLLVSPASTMARWDRAEFEPVLIEEPRESGSRLGIVWLADCSFPPMLKRSNFFDAHENRLACSRALRRWILSLHRPQRRAFFAPARSSSTTDLEPLRCTIGDHPGSAHTDAATARTLANELRGDFESVFWVDCRGRTEASIVGELGVQLETRLADDAETNASRVRDLCAAYRCLVVLEHSPGEVVEFPASGRASVLLAENPEPVDVGSLDVLRRRLSESTVGLHAGLRRGFTEPGQWSEVADLSRAAIVHYRQAARLAEAYEIIEWLNAAAIERGDLEVVAECGWERGWILESWGRSPGSMVVPEPQFVEQLAFTW
jgi:hypothetical protein